MITGGIGDAVIVLIVICFAGAGALLYFLGRRKD